MEILTLDDIDVSGKTVIVRVDINVPMINGKVSDCTRIEKIIPTLKELTEKKAKVVVISHFGRPKGKFVPSMSLSPLADVLGGFLNSDVKFGVDCIGQDALESIQSAQYGEVVLLENLRFHNEEKTNDKEFSEKLASLGEIYVNDAFSCSHRKHASIVGITEFLPSFAGRQMEHELTNLDSILSKPEHPLAAVIGGSKVSTKLELLNSLTHKVDVCIIGGGMANTFLKAKGYNIGKSIVEDNLLDTAKDIMNEAEKNKCDILLPLDVVIAEKLENQIPCLVTPVNKIPDNGMIFDIGPKTVAKASEKLAECKTIIWNGPMGVFETSPFDVGTISLARTVAGLTQIGKVKSIAGGGDTIAGLIHSGLGKGFSYISTAGGAFLEWLQGHSLPGVVPIART